MKQTLAPIPGFVILFFLYHAAEYCVITLNSITGFFTFQLLFFISAWLIAPRQDRKDGLAAWSLGTRSFHLRKIIAGVSVGVILYAISFAVSLAVGAERITTVPAAGMIVEKSLPFAFGVLFSSASEDLLTRGYPNYFLRNKMSKSLFVIFSAFVYLLNHIYKWGTPPDNWLYLLLLGILFAIPLTVTGDLWFTLAMHWAGNVFFFVTHEVIRTESGNGWLSANAVFCGCTILMLLLFRRFGFLILQRS